MKLTEFIKANREEIDAAIKGTMGAPPRPR